MSSLTNPFLRLATRVQQGKTSAVRFQKEVIPQLKRLIRRALRVGLTETPLCRRIKREAQRMGSEWRHLDPDDAVMIERLAQCVCCSVVDHLQSKPATHSADETTTGVCVTETTVV